ncbi:LysR family transcriptional regulator [Francisella philomiragia]|uniref:Oxidative stress transcriptional regulator n=1 Tax=Francisella philomiragia subsp. philomiragia (strain ATCC 25017 / CCUG 19701 / FSC 153 / O\|nr:LysR substrate-binding domain-containing protein [Francisella philomiragia]AJI47061.1 bacterial regulatory helix-turn-helix, lysR family protein [Francisella philomiragia]AJI48309.1 bacterial regulatory helix-turn-helix, lysR family protein [Francisella philomiragia]MBK2020922.1 LysR family transcriptional regulator [Francisella philomiragia]MBK2029905.1 LysR family transcriptional regulator [Francisella philomiragia]MBK2264358.1 LysR family transcriptional regulator [Francisella philomirag
MKIRTLEYVIALYETGSFKEASERCFVSQPALSMQIKNLEDQYGVKIFERTKKKVYTTQIGEKIVKQIYDVLDSHKNLDKLITNYLNKHIVPISIGTFSTLYPYLIPRIVPKLKRDCPNFEISVIDSNTDRLIDMLYKNQLDFVFLAEPIEDNNFHIEKVFKERFYLAASIDNPISQKKSLTLKELAQQKLILLDSEVGLKGWILETCKVNNIDFNFIKGSSLLTIREMVRVNEGVTLVPELACVNIQGFVYISIEDMDFHRNICVVRKKSSALKEEYSTIVNSVKETINIGK